MSVKENHAALKKSYDKGLDCIRTQSITIEEYQAELKQLKENRKTQDLNIGRQNTLIEGLIKELDASHVRLTTVVDVIVKYGLGRITN